VTNNPSVVPSRGCNGAAVDLDAGHRLAIAIQGQLLRSRTGDLPARGCALVAQDIGAAPAGEGLQAWLRRAPGFNAARSILRCVSRMLGQSGAWSAQRLGALRPSSLFKKPVEMFVVRDVEHAAHSLQNPAQRLASLGFTGLATCQRQLVQRLRYARVGRDDASKRPDTLTDPCQPVTVVLLSGVEPPT
jgi:hypothetical protein